MEQRSARTGAASKRSEPRAPRPVGIRHRRDIDGLRAVAVMGVILDHAGVSLVRSGHAGVDVFFAISGFLIGGIVATELAEGRFSFAAFYARRARRILPALFTVILATLPAAWALMTPDQLRYFGGGAFAAMIFLSNVWFYNRIDYFNPGAAEDPLIHTWSLGVEEQFYIALPLLMVLLWRYGRGALVPVIAVIAGFSLIAALALAPSQPQAAFYLIHTRAWELLGGVLAALLAPRAVAAVPEGLRGTAASLGLLMVIGGLICIPETVVWPGAWTLVPVVGTLLILLFGAPQAAASRLLGVAPIVGVGLISYSAYLWHQPILGFLALLGEKPVTGFGIAAAVGATLICAWISWALVEQPFRTRRLPPRIGRPMLGLATAGIAAFAIGGHLTEGYPSRLPPDALAFLELERYQPSQYWRCVGGRAEGARLDPASACVHGADAPPRVAVWGDSHAATIAEPLGLALAPGGISVRELTIGGCMPVTGAVNSGQNRTEYCGEHNDRMIDYLVGAPEIDVVVVHAFWNYYVERRPFDNRAGRVRSDDLYVYPPGASAWITDVERAAYLSGRLRGDLGRLTAAGKSVLLSYPLPEAGFDVPDWQARQILAGRELPRELGYPAAAFEDYSRLARTVLDGVGEMPGLHRIDLSDAICETGAVCQVIAEGEPLYFDDNHLSRAGVARTIGPLVEAVKAILARGHAVGP